ncbi:hypothetical protein L7F22_012356 [Adiantum nelumboides]|nr:hypothetical protein [Adiantum nelumboides]
MERQGDLSPSDDEQSCSMAMVQQAGLGRGFPEDACWAVESRQHRFSSGASTSQQIPVPGRGAILGGWAHKTLQKGFHDLHSALADDEGLTVYEGMTGFLIFNLCYGEYVGVALVVSGRQVVPGSRGSMCWRWYGLLLVWGFMQMSSVVHLASKVVEMFLTVDGGGCCSCEALCSGSGEGFGGSRSV